MKQIILDSKKRLEMAATFKVSRMTVWSALSYKTNSSKAKMLRAAARERGGVEVDFKVGSTERTKFDTYWIEDPHQMVQVFSDEVRLVLDTQSGIATIEELGEVVKTFGNATLSNIPWMQAQAQEIVNNLL